MGRIGHQRLRSHARGWISLPASACLAPAKGADQRIEVGIVVFATGTDRFGLATAAIIAAMFPRVDLYGFVDKRIMRTEDGALFTMGAGTGLLSISYHGNSGSSNRKFTHE